MLPARDLENPQDIASTACVAPRDLTEALLGDIWESVLDKKPVGT
jgi:hypothetical protein